MTAKKKVDIQKTGSREICGIINLVVFVLLCLSLFSYDWRDISWLEDPPKETPNNMFGRVGAWVSFFLFNAFGLGAYLVPFVFLGVALIQFLRQDLRALPKFGWGFLIVCAVSGLLQVQYESFLTTCRELNLDHAGGRLSIEIVDGVLVFLVKPLGATLICSFLLFIGLVMFVGWNEMINGSKKGVAWGRGLAANARARAYERQNHVEQMQLEREELQRQRERLEQMVEEKKEKPRKRKRRSQVVEAPVEPVPEPDPIPEPEPEPEPFVEPEPEPEPIPEPEPPKKKKALLKRKPAPAPEPEPE